MAERRGDRGDDTKRGAITVDVFDAEDGFEAYDHINPVLDEVDRARELITGGTTFMRVVVPAEPRDDEEAPPASAD